MERLQGYPCKRVQKALKTGMIFEVTTSKELEECLQLGEHHYKFSNYYSGDMRDLRKNFIPSWQNLIKKKIGKIFVMEKNEKIIGGMGFLITPDTEDGTLTCIGRFWYMDEKHRGEGVKVYRKVESYAKSVGCKKIIMGCLSFSHADKFKKLYTRMGFQENETSYIKHI